MFARTLKVLLVNLLCLVTAGFAAAQVGAGASPKYPAIESWQGKVYVVDKTGQRTELKRNFILREYMGFVTEAKASVKVALDENRHVVLGADSVVSEMVIPIVSWETGAIPIVNFLRGNLRWQQKAMKHKFNIALSSSLFEFIPPAGEFLFSLDPSKAYAEVKVFKGQLEFSATNGEVSVLTKEGQQAHFQGVIEDGEIAYDILLQGRKIPKGTLSKVSKIDSKYFAAEKAKVRAAEAALKKAADQRARNVKKTKRAGAICHEPEGLFNECSWGCEKKGSAVRGTNKGCASGSACVRRRCNANGQWVDAHELTAAKGSNICRVQPIVRVCDY